MYGWYAWKRNWTWQRRRSKTKLGQEGENVKEILVVGGGAAGIAAAVFFSCLMAAIAKPKEKP